MTCSHAYVKRLAADSFVCIDCGVVIKPSEKVYDTSPLVMPPYIYQLTEEYWRVRNPWSNITRAMALKYRWYGSMIYNREYLVMPVYDLSVSSEPVFYSARCLTDCKHSDGFVPPKYHTPLNRKRVMWKSWEYSLAPITTELFTGRVLVGEGVADAAWLSQIAPSMALLGSHGELDRPFILVLDGDERGILAAFSLVQDARKKGIVDALTVTLPSRINPVTKKVESDPTDFSITELKEIILEQTGVKL